MSIVRDLQHWLAQPAQDTFPLAEVILEFRKAGKHAVSRELLGVLAEVRAALPKECDALGRFLSSALDKHDDRFDNPSYLALHNLPLPSASSCPYDFSRAEVQRDRLIMLLVADLLGFEVAAHDGNTDLLPMMRPAERIVSKRCILGLLVLRPVMIRQGLQVASAADHPIDLARELCARVELGRSAEETQILAATLLTVSTIHDENMFLRVLQAYETTFAVIAVQLRAAITALGRSDAAHATRALQCAEGSLKEVSPLFSLVATMQPDAFMAFREYTDGASAIQSRSYKTIESLCRRPDSQRLEGPGFDAVPEVREQVLAGQPTLEDALTGAVLAAGEGDALQKAMGSFQDAMMDWRRMHYNVASRMLGTRRGTGYTTGVPYLAEARQVPVFTCPFAH